VKSNEHNPIRVSKDGLTSGIDVTAEISGNVRFFDVKKKEYSKDLEEELCERGIAIPRKDDGQFKFSDAKSLLKANEASVTGINIADCKSFKPKSKNTFRLLLNPAIE